MSIAHDVCRECAMVDRAHRDRILCVAIAFVEQVGVGEDLIVGAVDPGVLTEVGLIPALSLIGRQREPGDQLQQRAPLIVEDLPLLAQIDPEVLLQTRQDRVRVLHRSRDDLPWVAVLGDQRLELANDERRLIDPERMQRRAEPWAGAAQRPKRSQLVTDPLQLLGAPPGQMRFGDPECLFEGDEAGDRRVVRDPLRGERKLAPRFVGRERHEFLRIDGLIVLGSGQRFLIWQEEPLLGVRSQRVLNHALPRERAERILSCIFLRLADMRDARGPDQHATLLLGQRHALGVEEHQRGWLHGGEEPVQHRELVGAVLDPA